jgi:hypothetical protein
MTFGAFANLSEGTQRFFEGLGFGETGFTDLTGVEVLRKFAGQKVLSDLGQLKGALSEKRTKIHSRFKYKSRDDKRSSYHGCFTL